MDQLSAYLPGILIAFCVFAVGMFSPGPNILSIIGTSMGVGRDAGKALALGVASGSFLWSLLTWFALVTVASRKCVLVGRFHLDGGRLFRRKCFFSPSSAGRSLIAHLAYAERSAARGRACLAQVRAREEVPIWMVGVCLGESVCLVPCMSVGVF